jgi:hypothetical protein
MSYCLINVEEYDNCIEKDIKKGNYWLFKASEKGHSEAQQKIAIRYHNGSFGFKKGKKKNYFSNLILIIFRYKSSTLLD